MIAQNGKLMLAGCVLAAGALCMPMPKAHAGSRDAAVAAGIIGAVATGIILQQHINRQQAPKQARRAAPPKASNETAATPANAKDPFAGTGAPAGYATPVANKPMQ